MRRSNHGSQELLQPLQRCIFDVGESPLNGRVEEPDRATALMQEVLERRKVLWGDEDIYTLFAELNYGRVEYGLGDYEAAEARLQRVLPIGIRSVGKTHSGVVLAEIYLARSWVGLKRYAEAEKSYKRVLDEHVEGGRHKGTNDTTHRLLARWFLVECLDESRKLVEAQEASENVLDSLTKFGDSGYGLKHLLHGLVVMRLTNIRRRMSGETRIDGGEEVQGMPHV